MIVGETASVCALPAPVKPKRCFRFPPKACPALSLACPRPDFSHRFFNLGDEAARKYFVGGGRQWQNVQISTERESWERGGGEAGEGLSKKLKHYLHFSYDTTTIYYPPQPPCHQPLPQLILARRLSTLQPEDVDSCCCCCCCCRGWGCDVTGGC